MPYSSITDLPQKVQDSLPKHAQEIYQKAFNSAWEQYKSKSNREETAHKVAWNAVKQEYEKKDDKWVKK